MTSMHSIAPRTFARASRLPQVIALLGLLVAASACDPTMKTSIQDRSARSDDYLEQIVRHYDFPGVQYVLFDAQGVIYQGTAGHADVKGKVPMRLDHRVCVFSTTKVATGIAILQLRDAGLLDLDAKLQSYIPDMPYDVTIRQMLSHTSGIPNPMWGNLFVHMPFEHASFDRRAELRKVVSENAALAFAPGTQGAYSNLAYAILGELIEARSGLSYEDYVRSRIFAPLGVSDHEMGFDVENAFDQAKPYFGRRDPMYNILASAVRHMQYTVEGEWIGFSYPWYMDFPGHGGLVGRPSGYVALLRDFLVASPVLLSSASRQEMLGLVLRALKDAYYQGFALSWYLHESLAGHPGWQHGGGGAGYIVNMRIYPSSGIGSVFFTNGTRDANVQRHHDALDAQFLP